MPHELEMPHGYQKCRRNQEMPQEQQQNAAGTGNIVFIGIHGIPYGVPLAQCLKIHQDSVKFVVMATRL
jgi:hypothetical protein